VYHKSKINFNTSEQTSKNA